MSFGQAPQQSQWKQASANGLRCVRGAAEELPLLPRQGRPDRLQGLPVAAPLSLRPRQDPLAPDHRRLPAPPEPARQCGQAGAGTRPPALRERALSMSQQAILLKDVEGLGDAGAVVDVSPGYLRNFLAPRKLAQPATPASIAAAERRREQEERAAREQEERAQETAALLSKTVLTIQHQAGEDGKLFGSVTAK